MHVSKIEVKNFRLLSDAELFLEKSSTVIVGRNNCGKTSLTELFRRLCVGDKLPSFNLEDFSLGCHDAFWSAFKLKHDGNDEAAIRAACPAIDVRITVTYEAGAATLGPLSDFVIDLNDACTDAVALFRYQIADGKVDALFEGLAYNPDVAEGVQKATLCRAMRERVPRLFAASVFAIDPNDASNIKLAAFPKFRALLNCGFIPAQRALDDVTHKESDVLGKILESLVTSASSDLALPGDKAIADNLNTAVGALQTNIDGDFKTHLTGILPALQLFGYPGLNDSDLDTETTLDVKRLLTDHTKIRYKGLNGVNLPESYNGLGARNLIFILLKLLQLFKSYVVAEGVAGLQLVFIEEPEVHLHPQMQDVFVAKLTEIAAKFSATYGNKPWPVQFVVTTHSSHVANRASFDAMRYFLSVKDDAPALTRSTKIKNVKRGLGGTPAEDLEFLHKYLTLTRCDLFFADKAILIEGPTERIMLPIMISKTDAIDPTRPQLSRQYVSIVEVGGAYAHLFFGLLSFLKIPTLVITDLDAVKLEDAKWKACEVAAGQRTSNACLKKWFNNDEISLTELAAKGDPAKITELRRVAFQIPETDGGPCGRSFEDAFALANPDLFGLTGLQGPALGTAAYGAAEAVSKKTDFALKHLIVKTDWTVPRYIKDGLRWLAEFGAVAAPAAGGPNA